MNSNYNSCNSHENSKYRIGHGTTWIKTPKKTPEPALAPPALAPPALAPPALAPALAPVYYKSEELPTNMYQHYNIANKSEDLTFQYQQEPVKYVTQQQQLLQQQRQRYQRQQQLLQQQQRQHQQLLQQRQREHQQREQREHQQREHQQREREQREQREREQREQREREQREQREQQQRRTAIQRPLSTGTQTGGVKKKWVSPADYVKTTLSKQDVISKDRNLFIAQFKGYRKVFSKDYKDVKTGILVKYIKDQKHFRSGGILVKNAWPDYWVLQSVVNKRYRWSVPLQGNNIYYIKDTQKSQMVKQQKDAIYDAIKAGKCKLVGTKQLETLETKASAATNHKAMSDVNARGCARLNSQIILLDSDESE